MTNVLFTYSTVEEIRYLNDNEYLLVYSLDNNFNSRDYDYIDISLAIEHLHYIPQNKIYFQHLKNHLDYGCVAVINIRQAEIALNMFPTLFSEIRELSEEIPELKYINSNVKITKRRLYYYYKTEKNNLFKYFNKNNIQFIDINWLVSQEKINKINFNKEIFIDITSLIKDNTTEAIESFITKIPFNNVKYICEYDNYNHELNFYFEKEIHISKKFSNFETTDENEWKTPKIIDLNTEQFNDLENSINTNLIGHDTFKRKLNNSLKQFKILNDLNLKKIFSIFLLGGSGIGKTEVARIINNSLNNETQLVKINFGNYSSNDSINSLIGSPRGYIGSQDGELSLKLSKKHAGIILCDEFEKADSKIFSFFLELLEEGKFTDSQSREYDLNGYIIIFTSNLNSTQFSEGIPKEFQTRLDLISEFSPLTLEEKEKFVKLELGKIQKTMENNPKYENIDLSDFNITFNLNEIDNLRDIQREIYNQIINNLINTINIK